MKLAKPEPDQTSQETITTHTSTDRVPIWFSKISDDVFYRLIEQLTLALCTFASHDSRWILWEIINLIVKFISFSED